MYSGNERSALVGKAGEDFVAKYLKSQGYIILKRNWRDSRYGELDIVAENHECIAFVEVKTRHVAETRVARIEPRPASAVTPIKQQSIINTAKMFCVK